MAAAIKSGGPNQVILEGRPTRHPPGQEKEKGHYTAIHCYVMTSILNRIRPRVIRNPFPIRWVVLMESAMPTHPLKPFLTFVLSRYYVGSCRSAQQKR